MSISLFCYAKLNEKEVNEIIEKIVKDYPIVFSYFFLINRAESIDEEEKEFIGEEFKFFNTKSSFLVDYQKIWPEMLENINEEDIPDITTVSNIIYHYFGKENIIVCFQTDYVIEPE